MGRRCCDVCSRDPSTVEEVRHRCRPASPTDCTRPTRPASSIATCRPTTSSCRATASSAPRSSISASPAPRSRRRHDPRRRLCRQIQFCLPRAAWHVRRRCHAEIGHLQPRTGAGGGAAGEPLDMAGTQVEVVEKRRPCRSSMVSIRAYRTCCAPCSIRIRLAAALHGGCTRLAD